jgi:hypothetical protein
VRVSDGWLLARDRLPGPPPVLNGRLGKSISLSDTP